MSPFNAPVAEQAVVSGHSPLCRAPVGPVQPRQALVSLPFPIWDPLAGQVAWGFEDSTSALCREECSRQRHRVQPKLVDGQLEFTCLPPERDTQQTACVAALAPCAICAKSRPFYFVAYEVLDGTAERAITVLGIE